MAEKRKKIRVKKSAVPDLLDLDDDEIEEKLKSKKEPKIASPGRRSRASPGRSLKPSNPSKSVAVKHTETKSKSESKLGNKKTTSKESKKTELPNKAMTPASKKRKRESDVSEESPVRKKSRVTRESTDDTRQMSDVFVSIEPFDEHIERHVSESDSDEGGETSYFDQQQTTSSGHTLTGVKLLDSKEVHATVSQLRDTHQSEKEALVESYRDQFPQWWCQLRSGFNLLFYGLGSKKQLLEDFAKIYCKDNPLIVVNGYFPNLTVKAILNALVTKVLNVSDASVNAQFKSVHEQIEYLQHIWAKHEEIRSPRVKQRLHKHAKLYHDVPDRIYLLLHNIDGPALRTTRAQELLALLAHIPQLHLIASTDHLNAALLWDNRQLDRFNWLWLHVPSYARLKSETSYEGQISDQFAARRPGGRRGALQVLQTLPAKAKQIFLVLARNQLSDPQSRGLEFEQYLAQCQEQFLTSTSTVFKATLGEFVDHQLIQMKRGADGALYCSTPLHASTLKQILEEIDQDH